MIGKFLALLKGVIKSIIKIYVDLIAQFVLLFTFIYVTSTLGVVAITLEFVDSTVVEAYRWVIPYLGFVTSNVWRAYVYVQ